MLGPRSANPEPAVEGSVQTPFGMFGTVNTYAMAEQLGSLNVGDD